MTRSILPTVRTVPFTHELTVMETEDGFKYLSNYVYNSENNIFPEMVLRSERKNQIAEVE